MESKFDGGLLGLIGVGIVVGFVNTITLGLAAPWMTCYAGRWFAKHIMIDGKRLTFDGTGGQLFGTYIKWLLLCLVTLGIYSFWLAINMVKWVIKHVHTVEAEVQA